MKTLHFSIAISASRQAIWHVLLDHELYRRWAGAFAEGSHYKGDWTTGGTIRFLGPDGDGMVSTIAENRPPEFLSIKHLGYIYKGVDDTESEAVKAWAPSYENYSLRKVGSGAELVVDMDVTLEYEDFFQKTWPWALEIIKNLAEKNEKSYEKST